MGNFVVFVIVVGILVVRSIMAEKSRQQQQRQKPQTIIGHGKQRQTKPYTQPKPTANVTTKTAPQPFMPMEKEDSSVFGHKTEENAPETYETEDFRNTDELKKAVIYTEILNRKY